MRFSDRLRELRYEKGVRQKDVADYLGLSTKAYCYYELGTREPSLYTLIRLCDYYCVTADYILGRDVLPFNS